MDRKDIQADRRSENKAKKAENLRPVERVFTYQAEENLVHFEDDLVTDADETRSPGDDIAEEYGENLKSNIEKNLENEQ